MKEGTPQEVWLHEKEVPEISLPGRVARPFVGLDEGARYLSAGVVTFPPHSNSVAHVHKSEEEALYVVTGRGEVACDGRVRAIEPGSFVFVPPGVEHSVRNTGDEPIKFFYAFSPPVVIGTW